MQSIFVVRKDSKCATLESEFFDTVSINKNYIEENKKETYEP